MGCCPSKHESSAAAEPKKLLLSHSDLQQIAEHYPNSILPRITKALSDLTGRLDDTISAAHSSHAALLAYQRETKKGNQNKRNKGQKKKKKHTEDAFAQVTAELGKLEQAGDNLEAQELISGLGYLKNTMKRLLVRKAKIEKRMRSAKRWRKVWSVAFTAAFIGAMLAIVGLAVCGMPPMAISAVTAAATAVKAVEPWINAVWDEKEKELKDTKEIVEEMSEGVLLARELERVQPELEKVRIDFRTLADYVRFALREEKKASLATAEVEKKLGKVESEIQLLKGKANEWVDQIKQAQSNLNKIIRKEREIHKI